ncbi:hypothetical protein RN001_003787 [Aquatica leii]|uniref:Uncharacterized protein n=1 Tax=Aquatica leii TaxID=1421715 RepID=A0AAN7PP86_9COLE|nr:hypothetical protein RN001_003787 [Aquatica leii]
MEDRISQLGQSPANADSLDTSATTGAVTIEEIISATVRALRSSDSPPGTSSSQASQGHRYTDTAAMIPIFSGTPEEDINSWFQQIHLVQQTFAMSEETILLTLVTKFGARELDLIKPNTKVWVQTTPNSNWQKGVIMSRIDDRRYKVSLETGSTLVRNRIFIKPSIMNNNVGTNKTVRWYDEVDRRKEEKEYSCNLQKCELNSFKETNETMSYNLSEEDIGSSKLSRPSTNKEPDVSLNQAANHLVSRSGRSIKTPVRLNFERISNATIEFVQLNSCAASSQNEGTKDNDISTDTITEPQESCYLLPKNLFIQSMEICEAFDNVVDNVDLEHLTEDAINITTSTIIEVYVISNEIGQIEEKVVDEEENVEIVEAEIVKLIECDEFYEGMIATVESDEQEVIDENCVNVYELNNERQELVNTSCIISHTETFEGNVENIPDGKNKEDNELDPKYLQSTSMHDDEDSNTDNAEDVEDNDVNVESMPDEKKQKIMN